MTALDTAPATPKATVDRFHVEAAALRKTLDELDQIHRDAWRRESAAARTALAGLQADLALATAEAEAERAASKEELIHALTELLDAWRGRIDDLHLQGRLAEMNARDTIDRLRGDVTRPLNELRTAVLHALGQVRSVLGA
jgi:exonuclease VII large subunit